MTRSRMAWLVAIVCGLLLSGCRNEGQTDYVALTGRVFIFNYRVAKATYVVTLGKLRPIPEGSIAVAQFENPAGGDAITVEQKVWPALKSIALESPPLTCIKKDKRYSFSVLLKGPDGNEIQKISSSVLSTMDQSILPDAPLVVGPVYTPNPQLVGHPDGKIPGFKQPECPA